jgi:hypothetical protein
LKREALFLIGLVLAGFALRASFGIFRPTGDLEFYTQLNQSQLTRTGIQKEIMFSPLRIFPTAEARVLALAGITSFLNTYVGLRLLRRSSQRASSFVAFLVIVNFFLAQIDMHLVRQQISLYLFLIVITSKKFSLISVVLSILSLAYHEVAGILLASWLCAYAIRQFSLDILRLPLTFSAIGITIIMFLQSGYTGLIFLLYTQLAYLFVKKENPGLSLGNTHSIGMFAFCILNVMGYLTSVSVERLTGVFVSFAMMRLLYDGRFQLKNRDLKVSGLAITFSMYGLFAFA